MTGISIREFARRDGCSDTAVRKAIKDGRLRKLDDGTLDPDLVGTGWRPGNVYSGEVIEPFDESGDLPDGMIPPLVVSEAKKEFYLAKLRELEYDLKVGQVVLISEVSSQIGPMLARVRTRLLAFPAELAPALHRCKSAAEVQAELKKRVGEVLEELSSEWDQPSD